MNYIICFFYCLACACLAGPTDVHGNCHDARIGDSVSVSITAIPGPTRKIRKILQLLGAIDSKATKLSEHNIQDGRRNITHPVTSLAMLLFAHSTLSLRMPRLRRPTSTIIGSAPSSFELDLFSPARINLFLRILGRREDGLHDTATLFQAVTLGDRVQLARIPQSAATFAGVVRPSRKTEPIKQHVEFTYSPTEVDIPADHSNLVVRALTLFRSKLTKRDGGSLNVPRFRAHLIKNVPDNLGLGSDASNAATALYGANELCGRPASKEELVSWGAEIGSDVACFLAGSGSAYCTGRGVFVRGEHAQSMQPLASPLPGELFIVAPDVGLSTPAMFRLLAASNYSGLSDVDPESMQKVLVGLKTFHDALLVNDLDRIATQSSEELAFVKEALIEKEGFEIALISGLGPALYAYGRPRSEETAEDFAARFAQECNEALGVQVRVWPVTFLSAAENKWYEQPAR